MAYREQKYPSLRCSPEVMRRLRRVAGTYQEKMIDLTNQALKEKMDEIEGIRRIPRSEQAAAPSTDPSIGQSTDVQSGIRPRPETTREEARLIEKLVTVLHSPKPGLRAAIVQNLDQFEFAHDAWTTLRDQKETTQSPDHPRDKGRATEQHGGHDRAESLAAAATERIARVKRGLEDLTKVRKGGARPA